MQLQISTDYAVRILQYLHIHRDDLPTAMTISQSIGITYPFFIKIANQLKQKGLLTAVQGRNGGYKLAKPAEDVSLYDVFLAIEGDLQINRCLQEENKCTRGEPHACRLHVFLRNLQDKVITEMSGLTIKDSVHQE